MPALLIVALAVLPLLHVPPAVKSPRLAVAPTHTLTGPGGVIAEGLVLTVNIAVTAHVPPSE